MQSERWVSTRRGLITGAAAVAAYSALNPRRALSSYFPTRPAELSALDFGVTGNGSTNDAAAITAFFNLCSARGIKAVFPDGLTYDMGASGVTVPNSLRVSAGASSVFRRSANPGSYGALVPQFSLGDNIRWSGGQFSCTAVLTTSTTSNTVSGGVSKTWVVASAAGMAVNDFVRVYATAAAVNYCEGTVTGVSGVNITVNCTFSNGSGTFSSWSFVWGSGTSAPMTLTNSQNTYVREATASGLYYVGFVMSGVYPANVQRCLLRDCKSSVLNRGFYAAGNLLTWNLFDNCVADGSNTPMDYGFNSNTFGVPSATIIGLSYVNCKAQSIQFHGFEFGDRTFFSSMRGCQANTILNSAGVGFLVQFANEASPQFNRLIDCTAVSANGEGFAAIGAVFLEMVSCYALTCGQGFYIAPSGGVHSSEVSMVDCEALSNSGIGMYIDAAVDNTVIAGSRSLSNGTNFVNNSASTVGSPNQV